MRAAPFLSTVVVIGLGTAAAAAPPDVILVTLDTVRADRMGFLGAGRGLTPALDGLAREAVVFERAYAPAPLTTVSHATLLSGTQPPFHGVVDFGLPLPDRVPFLPELLKGAGYRTAAFVGSIVLDPKGGIAPGFDRGFDVYDAAFTRRRGGADPYRTKERRGAEVVARALGWLEAQPPGPLFLWVHIFDAHDPYDPPPPFATRFAGAPYDGEIAAADAAVGRLLDGLMGKGILDGALLVVASDHGESLGDHGETTHGIFLYDATIHVPLVVRLPRAREAGRRVASRASLVDVAPTVLEVAGVAAPAAMQGRSLLELFQTGRADERPCYAETQYSSRAFGWSPLASWRAEGLLFVEAPRRELFDQRSDPGSTRNLAEERPRVTERVAEQMEEHRRRWRAGGAAGPHTEVAPDLTERLAALGYASGGAARPPLTGADPKDKIEVANMLHAASLAAEDGDFERAIPLFERVVSTDPQIFMAQLELGLALARLREWKRALPPLRTAAARMPDFADARFTLGLVYSSLGRVPEAVVELRAALEREPRHYQASLLLGRILHERREPREALPHLERAVEARPDSGEARALLAQVYERLGRPADAARERRRVEEIRQGRRPPPR